MTTTAVLLFLKPITDMLYQYPALDYMIMGIALLALLFNIKRIKSWFTIDGIALFIVLLLTMTLIRSDFKGVVTYIKMVSAYFLYFVGRACGERLYKEKKYLVYSMTVVLIVNLIIFITRRGFQVWGTATTFSGAYFFKTDFALAMVYVIITLLYFSHGKKWLIYSACALCTIMIIFSNTRMDMLILLMVFGVHILYLRENKTGKQLRISMKYICIGIAAIFAGIAVISKLLRLNIFSGFNYISFSFDSLIDLFSASNTSGRTVIWAHIMRLFNSATLGQRLLGIDFVSDLFGIYDSHNAYLKMLFTCGYLGLISFVLFLLLYLSKLNSVRNRYLFYFDLSLIIAFVLQSLSASTVAYTQSTWIMMMYIGASITCHKQLAAG